MDATPETIAEEIARLTGKPRKSKAEHQRLSELQTARLQAERERAAAKKVQEAAAVADDREDHYIAHLLTMIGEQTTLIARRMRENADSLDRHMAQALANLDDGSDGWKQYTDRVEWALSEVVQADTALRSVRAMAACSELMQEISQQRLARTQSSHPEAQ